jgi:hypothetical protein
MLRQIRTSPRPRREFDEVSGGGNLGASRAVSRNVMRLYKNEGYVDIKVENDDEGGGLARDLLFNQGADCVHVVADDDSRAMLYWVEGGKMQVKTLQGKQISGMIRRSR